MNMENTRLAQLQRWMLDVLIAPDTCERQSISDVLLPGPMLDAAACLAIYQRSYVLRLRKCLAEQFPATRYALGDTLFDDFADAYLRDYPSNSYTLYELGRRFASWLEETRFDRDRPQSEREDWVDFMVDLADYECELFRLFDAPGHEEMQSSMAECVSSEWPTSSTDDHLLILQSCLVLVQYRYPVAWYYHEVRADRNPAFPPAALTHMVILRRNFQTTTYPISALHYRFLVALRSHGNVDQALSDIAAWTQKPIDFVTRSWVAEVRCAWIDAGFFIMANR